MDKVFFIIVHVTCVTIHAVSNFNNFSSSDVIGVVGTENSNTVVNFAQSKKCQELQPSLIVISYIRYGHVFDMIK